MSYCNEATLVKGDGHHELAVTLRCRSWTCPDCAPRRQRQLIAQALGGQPNRFLTLTMGRVEGMTTEEAARQLSRAWTLTRQRILRRQRWESLPALVVLEKHDDGWPHLHVLLRCPYLPQQFLSDCMRELCGGPIVWITKIQSKGKAARYCSKYCAKCTEKIGTCKRYWCTRDYDLRPPLEDDAEYTHPFTGEPLRDPPGVGYRVVQEAVAHLVSVWRAKGRLVEYDGGDRAWSRAPYLSPDIIVPDWLLEPRRRRRASDAPPPAVH